MTMKRNAGPLGMVILASILSASLAATEGPAIEVDFESNSIGPYSSEGLERDWPKIVWAGLYDRAHIVQDDEARGRVLRIAYPAGSVGPAQGGGQFLVSLPPSEELWLSYRIKFGRGFDFRLGGKLPGLTAGGGKYTGGTIPKEGDGWSARYMWRKGGKVDVYAYYVDMPGPWGHMFVLDEAATFVPGQWHQLTQRVKINTPDQSNGVLEVWFDGKKVFSQANIRWRIGHQGRIDSLYFSTFHGGNSDDWAPRNDSFAFFDDFSISREPPDFVSQQSPQ